MGLRPNLAPYPDSPLRHPLAPTGLQPPRLGWKRRIRETQHAAVQIHVIFSLHMLQPWTHPQSYWMLSKACESLCAVGTPIRLGEAAVEPVGHFQGEDRTCGSTE